MNDGWKENKTGRSAIYKEKNSRVYSCKELSSSVKKIPPALNKWISSRWPPISRDCTRENVVNVRQRR